ncbi:MAG: FAD-dependent oxidoreductase [Thermodesulfobacteriota bacterium]
MTYDVIIAGAGPAGIFAALELSKEKGLKVLVLEMGMDITTRTRDDLFHGFGGAGAFSDGKLNLSPDVGGFLTDYAERRKLSELIRYVDELYLNYGAPRELKGEDKAEVARIEEAAARAGLRLVPFSIRHLGTDRCAPILKNLRADLEGKIEFCFNKEVKDVIVENGIVKGVRTTDEAAFYADFVVLSPGRVGSHWLEGVAKTLGLSTAINPVDIGVRVEVPASILRPVTDVVHEAKFIYNSKMFNDPVRTFCMNPYGVVVKEKYKGFCTVNGHSFSIKKSDNTNFAILVSTTFTEPFKEPIAYGRYIASLANLLGEGIIVQRLGDLLHGRRSTEEMISKNPVKPTLAEATPGDLSFVLPYRYVSDILEMLEVMDKVTPGINSPSTLLYGVEVKFYSMRIKLTPTMETEVKNLFAAGDGAGVTRGIVQASVSGVMAARGILERMGGK